MKAIALWDNFDGHRRKHRGDAGDASPKKSQCGGRQCYSSPQILTT